LPFDFSEGELEGGQLFAVEQLVGDVVHEARVPGVNRFGPEESCSGGERRGTSQKLSAVKARHEVSYSRAKSADAT